MLFQLEAIVQQLRRITFDAIELLCDDVMWLEHGAMKALGPASEVVGAYRSSVEQPVGGSRVGGTVEPAEM